MFDRPLPVDRATFFAMTANMKRLDTPQAKEWAELALLQHDMKAALNAMKLWHDQYAEQETTPEKQIIGAALFRDAIIQFVACFDGQFSLSRDDIYGAVGGGLEVFQWFRDCRDCYAAHRFGPQRQSFVGVIPDPNGTRVGNLAMIYQGAHKREGSALIRFMQLAADHLDAKVKALEHAVSAAAKAMTKEEIGKLPDASAIAAAPTELRMSREKFDRLQRSKAQAQDPTKSQS